MFPSGYWPQFRFDQFDYSEQWTKRFIVFTLFTCLRIFTIFEFSRKHRTTSFLSVRILSMTFLFLSPESILQITCLSFTVKLECFGVLLYIICFSFLLASCSFSPFSDFCSFFTNFFYALSKHQTTYHLVGKNTPNKSIRKHNNTFMASSNEINIMCLS